MTDAVLDHVSSLLCYYLGKTRDKSGGEGEGEGRVILDTDVSRYGPKETSKERFSEKNRFCKSSLIPCVINVQFIFRLCVY